MRTSETFATARANATSRQTKSELDFDGLARVVEYCELLLESQKI